MTFRALPSRIGSIRDVNKPLEYVLEGDSRFNLHEFETVAL